MRAIRDANSHNCLPTDYAIRITVEAVVSLPVNEQDA